MSDIRRCPFCGSYAQVHIRQAEFIGQNYEGDKKITYYVYVACNRCKSRGKPIKTDPLVRVFRADYSEWSEKAIEAWNRRFDEE